MWGFNMFHQTGNPKDNHNQKLPKLVKLEDNEDIKVKNVSCGYFHTIALS